VGSFRGELMTTPPASSPEPPLEERDAQTGMDDAQTGNDAKSPGAFCICGRPLIPSPRGPARRSCSEACRRARQRVTRQLRRRACWSREWQRQADHGDCPVADAAREIAALAADIDELRHVLREV